MSKKYPTKNKPDKVSGLTPAVLDEFRRLQQLDPKTDQEIIEATNSLNQVAREADDKARAGSDFKKFMRVARDLEHRTITRYIKPGHPIHSYVYHVEKAPDGGVYLHTLTAVTFSALGNRGVTRARLAVGKDVSIRGKELYFRSYLATIDAPEAFAEFKEYAEVMSKAFSGKTPWEYSIEPKKTKFPYGSATPESRDAFQTKK